MADTVFVVTGELVQSRSDCEVAWVVGVVKTEAQARALAERAAREDWTDRRARVLPDEVYYIGGEQYDPGRDSYDDFTDKQRSLDWTVWHEWNLHEVNE